MKRADEAETCCWCDGRIRKGVCEGKTRNYNMQGVH